MKAPARILTGLLLTIAVTAASTWAVGQTNERAFTAREATLLYEVERGEARKPIVELQDKLDAALERLEQRMQNQGNLEALLLIQKERASFRNRTEQAPASGIEELESLREIYWREYGKLQPKIEKTDREALSKYTETLESIIRELTRESRIDEALELQKAIDEARAELEGNSGDIAKSPDEEIVLGQEENYVINTDCELTRSGSRFIITSDAFDGTYVESERIFRTPFRIRARAETDTSNIRFYFGQVGIVVLGWEVRPTELRIVEPIDRNQNGIPDAGSIKSGRMHDIEIEVDKDTIRVSVDGELRGEVNGDYTGAEGPIGIGPARGSILTVEYLMGIQEGDRT